LLWARISDICIAENENPELQKRVWKILWKRISSIYPLGKEEWRREAPAQKNIHIEDMRCDVYGAEKEETWKR